MPTHGPEPNMIGDFMAQYTMSGSVDDTSSRLSLGVHTVKTAQFRSS